MRCTSCGTELSNPQQYCTKCGKRLATAPQTSPLVQAKPPAAAILQFNQIIGQKGVVSRLAAICEFSRARGTAAGHLLITGADGMGKRTIAHVLAAECGVAVVDLDATTIERKTDFTAAVTCLERREMLFLQNIGALPSNLRQIFLNALQHERIDLVIGQGAGARVHPFQLNQFTCVATAHRASDCPLELGDAFALTIPMEPYSQSELEAIASLISAKVGVTIGPGVAKLISQASGGIPHKIGITIQRLARLIPGIINEKDAAEVLSTYGFRASTGSSTEPFGDLQNLTGIQFEELITALLARLGFHAQMTKASGDGGIDIVADLDRPLVGGTYLIQCKRFSPQSLVGAPVVREFHGSVAARPNAVKGVLITTSGFTSQATDFASEVGIELIDGEQLSRLLSEQEMGGANPQRAEPLFGPRTPRRKPFLF
jgi:Holliday junction resolvasome RuvABC ATP-dependent DNA helicase subunit